MGLVTGLLLLPLAPVRGVEWVARQVRDAAEREYYDTSDIVRELALLEEDLRSGLIDEEEFDRREDELLDLMEERRREARERGVLPAAGDPAGDAIGGERA
ncbi:gas vesicle protein GvpG [Allostreptomyces psammosilenae]|uniref:Cytochrome c-type biogenesis protein CcmH/NrfG n=1 Tax=Allostreptomyces psammosilenae TaxID=1892865 RepID=A0A852ZUQ2_9ACTN|nr:gas vesicle protein GvpG [Allostreptomyces psammosilenae]NYI06116.1 cytochrome c-type biogenesis protein CcmH/NrfG [Allostreptomyces psammosilenae]